MHIKIYMHSVWLKIMQQDPGATEYNYVHWISSDSWKFRIQTLKSRFSGKYKTEIQFRIKRKASLINVVRLKNELNKRIASKQKLKQNLKELDQRETEKTKFTYLLHWNFLKRLLHEYSPMKSRLSNYWFDPEAIGERERERERNRMVNVYVLGDNQTKERQRVDCNFVVTSSETVPTDKFKILK